MDKEDRDKAREFVSSFKASSVVTAKENSILGRSILTLLDLFIEALDEIDRLEKHMGWLDNEAKLFKERVACDEAIIERLNKRIEELKEDKEDSTNMFSTMTTTTTEYKEPKLCPVCEGKGG